MKFGVVGYGSIGQRHADNLRKLGHKVVIYDPAYTGSDVKRETGIYDDKSIDGVIIATPSPYHEGPLRACVERGKHILVEKPISVAVGALQQLLHAADDKGLVVMVGNNLRFHAAVERTKEWVSSGFIGQPLWASFICAQQNTRYRDSVVLNWGAHEVDLAIHLFGAVIDVPAASVCSGVVKNKDGEIAEAVADFVLLHSNGVRSSFHLDYITPNEIRESWIVGEDKNIGLDLVGRRTSLGTFVQGHAGSFDEDYKAEMKAFADRIEHGFITPGANGWQGLEVLDTLLNVRKKAGLP